MKRLAVALTAVALTAAGCGSADSPPASGRPDAVTVGLISIVDVAPIYLGKAKGFFADRNIDLTLKPAEAGTETIPAVLSGDLQFGYSNIVTLLLAQSQGLPVKVLVNGNDSTGVAGKDFGSLMVAANSPVRSVADLAGRKVAVNVLQNVVELAVRASAVKAGVDPESIQYVKLAFPEMPAALAAGRVDAAFVVEPFQQIVTSSGGRPIASSLVDLAPNLSVAQYFTSKKMLADNPDLANRFTAAMKESLSYAEHHPEEVRKVLPTYTKIPEAVIPDMVLPKWVPEVNKTSVTAIVRLARKEKILTTEPDLDDLLP